MGANYKQRIAVTIFLLGVAMILLGFFSAGIGVALPGVAMVAGALYMLMTTRPSTSLASLVRSRKTNVFGKVLPLAHPLAGSAVAALWNSTAGGQHTRCGLTIRLDHSRYAADPVGVGLGKHHRPRSRARSGSSPCRSGTCS